MVSLEYLSTDLPNPIFFKYTLPIAEAFKAFGLLKKAGFSAADIYPSADGAGKAVQDEINYDKAERIIEKI